MKSSKMMRLAAPLVALGLTLSACGGNADGGSDADYNDQDVAFATDMIPHHAQAVQMSDIAIERAQSQEVKDLAEDISGAQGPEIEQMSSWLESWGEDVPDTDGDMAGMDHSGSGGSGGSGGMDGMMSSEQMDELESASGAAFDELFLSMMIEHHQGAIEMAQTQQAEGQFPEAVDLAETIEKTQAAEIETMQELLASS